MPEDVRIELMTRQDLPQVLAVEGRAHVDPWAHGAFAAELDHAWSHCRVLRRAADGSILGYMVFWVVADEAQLLNVAVAPEARGRGLGRALLAHLVAEVRRQGVRLLTLEVRASNAPARALYDAFGFRAVAVRPRYYAAGDEDALVMNLELPPADLPAPSATPPVAAARTHADA